MFAGGAQSLRELYRVPVDGSAPPVRISGTMVTGGGVNRFAIGSDSARVVYSADQATNGVLELYSVPLAGGAPPIRLSGPMPHDGSLADPDFFPEFRITPDASGVVYLAGQRTRTVDELFWVPIHGGSDPLVLGPPVTRPGCGWFEITPDSRRVVFLADREASVTELFASVIPRVAQGRHLRRP